MKKISLFLTFLIVIINNSYAQIELNPSSAHRLNIKAVGSGDLWGVFGTTSTTSTNMVFRSGISNTNNWQNTGTITGVLGYSGIENMGLKLASYDKDLGLYGIEKLRLGTNGDFNRMVILENGNVGVNWPSPIAKFQVYRTGDAAIGWGGYVSSLKAGMMVDGTHVTANDNFDAVGIAGHGSSAAAAYSNIGILGTSGNSGLRNIGVLGFLNADIGVFKSFEAIRGEVVRSATNIATGVYGKVSGNATGGAGYGVYGEASGTGGTIYAGYFSGNTATTGFTQLGSDAPKIKTKKITGNTATTEGAYRDIAHGLSIDKILSIDVIVAPVSTVRHQKNWTAYGGHQFDYYYDATHVWILNVTGKSNSILNKPLTIYITYEE